MKHEVIPDSLAGVDARVATRGRDGHYQDAYLARLDALHPIEAVLGSRFDAVWRGEQKALAFYSGELPLKHHIGRLTMEFILCDSARAGSWNPQTLSDENIQDLGYDTVDDLLQTIKKISSGNGSASDFSYVGGIGLAHREGLVLPLAYWHDLVILPSQRLVIHCALSL